MLSAFYTILKAFIDICLFRSRPQDLPASQVFLVLCLIIYTLASIILALATYPPAQSVMSGLLETSLLIILSYGLLKIRGLGQRWVQTCTALAGTGVLFSIMATPLFYLADQYDGKNFTGDILLAFFILISWSVAVMSHILKHALSISFPLAVVTTLIYVFLISTLISVVFPLETIA